MSAHNDRQVRLPSTIETAADDGYWVRLIQDHADGINNAIVCVELFKVAGHPCIPWWYSHASTTDERVIAIFAPRIIPMAYNYFAWGVGHVRTAGAGSVIWRLYTSRKQYQGDVVFEEYKLGTYHKNATITTDSDTHDVPAVDNTCGPILRDNGLAWLVLTAQAADVATRAALTDFDIWPVRV